MTPMERQKAEFEALMVLSRAYGILPAVVDDDYPAMRGEYEDALAKFINICLEADGRRLPTKAVEPVTYVIEAPGPYYLGVRDIAGYHYFWSEHRSKALRLYDERQANMLIDVVRAHVPQLFDFAKVLREPKVVVY